MTDETKKLFDAPWVVTREEIRKDTVRYGVAKSHLDLVAIDLTHEDAHRLARLPELYEALGDETMEKCNECLHENLRMGRIPFTGKYNLVESGCPFKDEVCNTASNLELLKKVMDGK